MEPNRGARQPTAHRRTASALAVPVAFLAANATSYALLLVAAHLMTSPDYGALSSLLGLLLIASVPMLALQTVAARRSAIRVGHKGVIRGTAEIGVVSALAVAALSPALAAFLHLHGVGGILLIAAVTPVNAVLGTATGIAQGQRRFARLAVLILAGTGGRSAGGLAGVVIGGTPETTLLGILAGTLLAAVLAIGTGRLRRQATALPERDRTGFVAETARAAYAHGTFFVLSSLDVLLARHVLSSSAAGAYAVGSVVTRAVLWLPQSMILLLFASLAQTEHHRAAARRATATVVLLGGLCVLATAALGELVITVIGGHRYRGLAGSAWLYAMLGALLAVLQLFLLYGLAQQRARRAAALWATIVVDVVLVSLTSQNSTPTRLVVTLTSVAALAAVASVGLLLRHADEATGPAHRLGLGFTPPA